MVGSPGTSIFIIKEAVNQSLLSEVLYFFIPTLMFFAVLSVNKFYYHHKNDHKDFPFSLNT
jgi:hypothetical protein